MANMLAYPIRRIRRGCEKIRLTAKIYSERGFDEPLSASFAVAFIVEFDQDCDELAAGKQQQRVAVGAVRLDPGLIG